MFIHQHQLEYQLAASSYCSEQVLEDEIRTLFLPGWQLIGSRADFPREGSFVTRTLLGEPLIIWRREGAFHAFLNVCSHRHCQLTAAAAGCQPALRCQYHGWEYGTSGYTGKIPDAGCFRPFDRERARLHKFRTATCGDLIFVSLADDGPTLQEYLGPVFPLVAKYYSHPWAQNWSWEHEYPCNWKLPVENTVETYHLPSVHKGFFAGIYPSEAAQTHELEEDYTTLRYDLSEDPSVTRRQRQMVRILGGTQPTDTYTHHLVHPNLVFTFSDLYLHTQVYLPVTPTRTRTLVRMFSLRGVNRTPWAWFTARLVAWIGTRMDREVQLEDASVFGSQQAGIARSRYSGCLGTREERIYMFQRFVRSRLAGEHAQADTDQQTSVG